MFDPNHEDYFKWMVIAEHYRREAERKGIPRQNYPTSSRQDGSTNWLFWLAFFIYVAVLASVFYVIYLIIWG